MEEDQNKIKEYKMSFECQLFYSTSHKLLDNMTSDFEVIPCAINCAFTCELALKSLLLHFDKEFEKIHNLAQLLFLLDINIITEIFIILAGENYSKENIDKIYKELLLVSDAFEEYRYISDYSISIRLDIIRPFMEAVFKIHQKYCKVCVYPIGEPIVEKQNKYIELDKKFNRIEKEVIARSVTKIKKKRNK